MLAVPAQEPHCATGLMFQCASHRPGRLSLWPSTGRVMCYCCWGCQCWGVLLGKAGLCQCCASAPSSTANWAFQTGTSISDFCWIVISCVMVPALLPAHTLGMSGPLSRLLTCWKLVKCFFFLIGCSGCVLRVSRVCEAAMESYCSSNNVNIFE